ncbi:ABC transporter permease [Mesorhizobium sp. BR1-1-16]|uniref:ABC transporter permease n=1 Tax=Mesorhizobium sp. BR1-1-16 TaxID=2876653 RepID=UPI001CCD350A|nr:ABC transporter permease [Mesorhizobium sp. BR1-1-16]MBZ9936999.1 ABC transporter permease [Mesorhizobium sp. BR1-1-16]
MPSSALRQGPTFLSVACLLVLWQIAAAFGHSALLPGPIDVARTIGVEALHGPLLGDLAITMARVVLGFAISMAIGTVLGIVLGRFPLADRLAYPWVLILLNAPALVVIVLCYLWLGLTEAALLVAVALSKVPAVVVSLREGARQFDADLTEMARSFRFGPWRTLRHVLMPQLAPYCLAAARNGLALIWKIVLVAELIGRPDGIGFELQTSFQLFDIERVLAYATAFVGCLLLIEMLALAPADRHILRWRR